MLLLNAGQYVHTRNIDLTPKASDLISLQTIQNSTGQHTGKGTDILRMLVCRVGSLGVGSWGLEKTKVIKIRSQPEES